MKQIQLSDERREALIGHLQTLFSTEFDETLSDFRAGEILDRMLKTLGPTVYNQAVEENELKVIGDPMPDDEVADLDARVQAEHRGCCCCCLRRARRS